MKDDNSIKVCFVGLGSIAARHIRNLAEVCRERGTDLNVDVFRHTDLPVNGELPISGIYTDIKSVPSDYDIVFITNPTHLHAETLLKMHDKGRHFFIEKPAATIETAPLLDGFRFRTDSVYYVACPLRYSRIIQYIDDNIDINSVIAARCICSSYLPDWRPGADYRECYSAHSDMGGGVTYDLIHEWDYIYHLFGMPDNVLYSGGHRSGLEIDSDDYAAYIAEYPDKTVELHLDYYGRKAIREIMLFLHEDTAVCSFIDQNIRYLNSGLTVDLHEERDDYQKRELSTFLDMTEGIRTNTNDPATARKVLNLTKGIME